MKQLNLEFDEIRIALYTPEWMQAAVAEPEAIASFN
jgi:hypothetical protein